MIGLIGLKRSAEEIYDASAAVLTKDYGISNQLDEGSSLVIS
jgi:hypothetical protein